MQRPQHVRSPLGCHNTIAVVPSTLGCGARMAWRGMFPQQPAPAALVQPLTYLHTIDIIREALVPRQAG